MLDGFKSYAKRTVVGPLDASFNAITGRNGTGKSNVLDGSEMSTCGVNPFQSASTPSARTVCSKQCHAERKRAVEVV